MYTYILLKSKNVHLHFVKVEKNSLTILKVEKCSLTFFKDESVSLVFVPMGNPMLISKTRSKLSHLHLKK